MSALTQAVARAMPAPKKTPPAAPKPAPPASPQPAAPAPPAAAPASQPAAQAIAQAVAQAPAPAPAPTTLATEQVGDGSANCLEQAAVQARPGQDNVVFLQDQRSATAGNSEGAGHTLIEDRATGRVWDPNDGTPPLDPSGWPYASTSAWIDQQPPTGTGAPPYVVEASIPAEQVQQILSVPVADRPAAIAASSNPDLQRIADRTYADSEWYDPYSVYLDPACYTDPRLVELDETLADLDDEARFEDIQEILEGESSLGALNDHEQTRVLDFATNAWFRTDGYNDLNALAEWSGQDPERAEFVSRDLAARAVAFEALAQEYPEVPVVQSFQHALAVAAVDAPGTESRRRDLIDDLGPQAGLLFAALQPGTEAFLVGNAASGFAPHEEERAEAAALLLEASAGTPTDGSAAVVAAGLSELTDEALEDSEDLADWRDTVDLGESFAHALAAHTHPDDPALRREEGERLAEILGTGDGRELVFSPDRPLGGRVEVLQAIRAHPEWGTDLETNQVELTLMEPRARDLLELRGDTPMTLFGTDLENTIGFALGFPVQGIPEEETDAERDAREAAVAEGRHSLFEGEPAEEIIGPIVDQIRNVGGDEPQVTVLPIRTHDGDGQAVDLSLFRVQDEETGEDRFVDHLGRRYDSFDDWRNNNQLPSGRMIFPEDGHLTENEDGSVALEEAATPSTVDTFWEHLSRFADTAALVGGTIAGGLILIGSGGTAAPFVVGGAAAWGAYRAGDRLQDRYEHGQSINPFTDGDARSLWLHLGADALTAATLGTSQVASRLGGAAGALRPQAAAAASFLGIGAMAFDAAAAADVGYRLIDDWENLTGAERAQLSLSLGFWSAGTAVAARNAFPNGIDAWRPQRSWTDRQYRDFFLATASPETRAQLDALTPAQLRAIYPDGTTFPIGLDRIGSMDGFASFARNHPEDARVLADGASYFNPQWIRDRVDQVGFASTAGQVERMLPVITPHPDNPNFVIVERGPSSPDFMPEYAIYPTGALDHNGAFHQLSLVPGRTSPDPRLIPTEYAATTGPRPSQLVVNGEPLDTLDNVLVFSSHGSRNGFAGVSTSQAATMVADQVAAARTAGGNVDYVVLNACHQRDRQMFLGGSNAEQFQADLRAELAARGLPTDVTVLAASRGGPTYGYGQRDWLSRDWSEAEYTPADDGAAFYATHSEAAVAALYALGGAGGGYVVYEAVRDD